MPNEANIKVVHFHKEPVRFHGIPFRIRIIPGEPFPETRKRLLARIGAQEKDLAKIKFVLLPANTWDKPVPLEDGEFSRTNAERFRFGGPDF